jgi:hypothetical protein
MLSILDAILLNSWHKAPKFLFFAKAIELFLCNAGYFQN